MIENIRSHGKNLTMCGGIFFLVFCDQISKLFARTYLREEAFEITNFFRLQFVENEGAAFSIPIPNVFLVPFTCIIIFFLGKLLIAKKTHTLESVAFMLIFSGAAGNLIDRIFLGKVTDFLSFWNFPIFNFADSFISVGVALYIWREIRVYQ